jgi:homopolymeric O-antigen transport system ATP-binding protein
VAPTSGHVDVHGRISNLLQIGSGFHPDFTGRQNVFATLAHQGVVGREAANLFDDIVAFSEIAEYIDQPMKTYSTGMCSRLMFSSAIVTSPEVLIVDEILGVGDAYFAHKSFERMRELSSSEGTTLLLVTHDVYSAMNLCDRFVWIDRGRVQFDGDGRAAVAMYEASIKAQEEQRLRQENAARLSIDPRQSADQRHVHVLVRSRNGFALNEPLALESIELAGPGDMSTALRVANGAENWHLLPESSLGPAETVGGRPARTLRSTGSIFHKAEWIVTLPAAGCVERMRVRWHYRGRDIVDAVVCSADRTIQVANELGASDEWQEAVFEAARENGGVLAPQKQVDYGTGAVRIEGVQFLNAVGRDVVQARHGDPLTIRITARVDSALADRRVTVIVGFRRQGSSYNGSIYEPARALPDSERCAIDLKLDPMCFGSGKWFVSVGIGKPGLYERPVVNYFATDPDWYDLRTEALQLDILSAGSVDAVGCFVVHPATVSCEPITSEATVR